MTRNTPYYEEVYLRLIFVVIFIVVGGFYSWVSPALGFSLMTLGLGSAGLGAATIAAISMVYSIDTIITNGLIVGVPTVWFGYVAYKEFRPPNPKVEDSGS